jgi:hypothetical protein
LLIKQCLLKYVSCRITQYYFLGLFKVEAIATGESTGEGGDITTEPNNPLENIQERVEEEEKTATTQNPEEESDVVYGTPPSVVQQMRQVPFEEFI